MIRLPRCAPDTELRYKDWVIPKGVGAPALPPKTPWSRTY